MLHAEFLKKRKISAIGSLIFDQGKKNMSVSSIVGVVGRLEISYLGSEDANAPIALFLHPDPQMGGNMNNRVITSLFKQFVQSGYSCLSFNFRGVGKSEGSYDHGEGELIDAATALDYLQLKNENCSGCCIVGYSFGAWIGIQLIMRRPEVTDFLLVAPTLKTHNYEYLGPSPERGFVILPEDDPAYSDLLLENFIKQFRDSNVTSSIVPNANHFFDNQDEVLEEIVYKDFLSGTARG